MSITEDHWSLKRSKIHWPSSTNAGIAGLQGDIVHSVLARQSKRCMPRDSKATAHRQAVTKMQSLLESEHGQSWHVLSVWSAISCFLSLAEPSLSWDLYSPHMAGATDLGIACVAYCVACCVGYRIAYRVASLRKRFQQHGRLQWWPIRERGCRVGL